MLEIRREQLEALRSLVREQFPDYLYQEMRLNGYPVVAEGDTLALADKRGNVSRLLFDDSGLPFALEHPSGAAYGFRYDEQGRLIALEHPGGRTVDIGRNAEGAITVLEHNHTRYELAYDSSGKRLSSVRFPDGSKTTYAYDGNGSLILFRDRADQVTKWLRSPEDGALHTVVDPLNRRTRYETDSSGRLSAVVHPNNLREEYAYDPDANIATITQRAERERPRHVHQVLDGRGATRNVFWDDGAYLRAEYEGANLSLLENESDFIVLQHDDDGNLRLEQTSSGEVAYDYDPDGRVIAQSSIAGTVRYEYDIDGRLCSAWDWDDREVRFTYAEDGTLKAIRYGNGLTEQLRYNSEGRLRKSAVHSAQGVTLRADDYQYDLCARLQQAAATDETGTELFRRSLDYDRESRVTADTFIGPALVGRDWFTYDRKGNIREGNGESVQIGRMDEPRSLHGRSVAYDAWGNAAHLPLPAGILSCDFSANGTLSGITIDGARVWHYEYDGVGRRILKTDGTAEWRYGWAEHQMIWEEYCETPDSPVVHRDYLWVPGGFAPIACRENGRTYWLQTDTRGAVVRVFDSEGEIVWEAWYESFGAVHIIRQKIRQPWRLMGHYEDEETGLNYNHARYYCPALKSYLSRDPAWYHPCATNYSYCRNDPWNRADRFGAFAPLLIAAGAIALGAIIGAVFAAAAGGDPVAGAVNGGLAAVGSIIGFFLGGPPGAIAGGIIGSGVGGFAGSVVEQSRRGDSICWPCALEDAGIAAAVDAALLGIGHALGLNRLLSAIGKRLFESATPLRRIAVKAAVQDAEEVLRVPTRPAESAMIAGAEGAGQAAEKQIVRAKTFGRAEAQTLFISVDEQEKINALIAKRKAASAVRDKLEQIAERSKLSPTQEETLTSARHEINEQSRFLGERAADNYVKLAYPEPIEQVYPPLGDTGSRSGDFDRVYKYVGADGKPSYVVVEAKGGGSRLGTRMTDVGLRAQQGSPEYFQDIARNMQANDQPIGGELQQAFTEGRVEYIKVQAPINAAPGIKVTVAKFDLR